MSGGQTQGGDARGKRMSVARARTRQRIPKGPLGSGTIGRVGHYKHVPTVWIDFDDGQTNALALEFGLPHLSQQTTPDLPKRRQWFGRGQR